MHQTTSARDLAIIELLRLYRDFQGVSTSGERATGHHSAEGRTLYMPGSQLVTLPGGVTVSWDASGCDLLDELLNGLRSFAPSLWWHVTERYVRCEVRQRRVRLERSRSGQMSLPRAPAHSEYLGLGVRVKDSARLENDVVVESWSPKVRRVKVDRGVNVLARAFPWDRSRRGSALAVAA